MSEQRGASGTGRPHLRPRCKFVDDYAIGALAPTAIGMRLKDWVLLIGAGRLRGREKRAISSAVCLNLCGSEADSLSLSPPCATG